MKNLIGFLMVFAMTLVVKAEDPVPHPAIPYAVAPDLADEPGTPSTEAGGPSDIQTVPALLPTGPGNDIFGLPRTGSLQTQVAVPSKAAPPQPPLVTLGGVLAALRVEMIDPPNSIMIHGKFIDVGSRIQVTYKGVQSVLTLISVQADQILFGWDTDNTQASIHVRSPNAAQVLTDSGTGNDPLTSSPVPRINLDADALSASKKQNPPSHLSNH